MKISDVHESDQNDRMKVKTPDRWSGVSYDKAQLFCENGYQTFNLGNEATLPLSPTPACLKLRTVMLIAVGPAAST